MRSTQTVAEDPAFRKKCNEMSMHIDYESAYHLQENRLKEEVEEFARLDPQGVGIMKK